MIELFDGRPLPGIMGIVNATGDSFSEGEKSAPATALDRALFQADEGADVVDVGGESTRPGAEVVSESEEIARILPVIKGLQKLRPSVLISVDTRKSRVAYAACDCGAKMINDVSMLRFSPDMVDVVAEFDVALVIGHSRGVPQNMREARFCQYPGGVAADVAAELSAAREAAIAARVEPGKIWIDPDFGFAKSAEQDWELMRGIAALVKIAPVVAGVSRKSCIGTLLGEPDPGRRMAGSLAAALYLASAGVALLRVHDVGALRDGLKVWRKLH